MASACLNRIGISPENLPECSRYGWFSHRLSITREMEEDVSKSKTKRMSSPEKNVSDPPEVTDPAKEGSDPPEEEDPATEFDGFEFRLHDPVIMLPADELFSDGKLVPLQLPVIHQEAATSTTTIVSGVTSPETPCSRRRSDGAFAADAYVFSPRAPRCSSRWKELLGFGKLHQSSNNNGKVDNNKRTPVTTRSIRQLLHRSSKSSTDSSINLPLLKEADNESVSVSSRPSLSSSSSSHDLDDLPRLSLDSDKPKPNLNLNMNTNPNTRHHPRSRMVKTRTQSTEPRATTRVGRSTIRRSQESTGATGATVSRGLSVDSPRMNSSGKIVFHSLERSSSSPSSFNGGPRFKHRGMERSYSANVRITPVLNVPVCSLRGSSKSGGMFGFPIFSSQQKREASSSNNGGSNRSQRFNSKP